MAEHAKAKPKRKPNQGLTDKKQSERFKDAAREAEVVDEGELFEQAFSKIVPAKRPKSG